MHSHSAKSEQIKSFIAMDILEAAQELRKQGRDVISFGLGEPDFQPPQCVQEACIRAIRENKTKYTHSQGLIELREAIAEHYLLKYKAHVNPDQIIVTPGTSPAFLLIFATLLEQNTEVILPNPHYPCDANFVEFFDGQVRELAIQESEDFQWNIDKVKELISEKTRALFMTSPSNPTGTVIKNEILKKLSLLGVPIVSDEIYHGLVYDGEEHSALEFSDLNFVVNGFSKAYAMTGYRLGYVISPQKFIRPMQKIQQNFIISASQFIQEAGIAALKEAGPDLERMRGEFKKRRDFMLSGLKKLGFPIHYTPQGAFYIFVKSDHLSKSSFDLSFDILNKANVAVTPGIDFGSRGEGYLRFSYATSIDRIEEGLQRIKTYIEAIS